ncbi:hypothetical protein SUGI_0821340 [Cryptomeria japonica]|nr:hypothetical protein SUGI_0821340 [Cryptomeria japonica]
MKVEEMGKEQSKCRSKIQALKDCHARFSGSERQMFCKHINHALGLCLISTACPSQVPIKLNNTSQINTIILNLRAHSRRSVAGFGELAPLSGLGILATSALTNMTPKDGWEALDPPFEEPFALVSLLVKYGPSPFGVEACG